MDGLEKFREAFADYTENYVIIGGTACELNMADTVVRARATHDIDMVIIVENMTEAFARRFWQFVREAGIGLNAERRNQTNHPSMNSIVSLMVSPTFHR